MCTQDVFVLDLDVRADRDGRKSFGRLVEQYDDLPDTLTSCTGGGGMHYFLRTDGPVGFKCSTNRLGSDIKTSKGYVIAPPSIHSTGQNYCWADGLGLGDVEIATAPEWLLERLSKQSSKSRTVSEWLERVKIAPMGERNDTLNRAAFALGRGIFYGRIREADATLKLRDAAGIAGLSHAESIATIKSGLNAGMAAPPSIFDTGMTGSHDGSLVTVKRQRIVVKAGHLPEAIREADSLLMHPDTGIAGRRAGSFA